ncbi:MAG TPA: NAD-dependent epimerase/dehydratase family protein [Actinomycetota bacterium]|nr:NAD-dependent epimerase/dehydratase family protein [Actinomycetota bacterium]
MRALVTGAAGFVGSTLSQRLASDGYEVVAIDSLTPYYDESQKRTNLEAVTATPGCDVIVDDLRTVDVARLLDRVDVVFHQAGQPGVRASWDAGFAAYVDQNVLVTQRLLEAARGASLTRFVLASSSSVYGNAPRYPTVEDDLPRPQSPYGVTKLAAEHLAGVYARNFGVPTVSLRYFTVYGPRQRPDMAMHRLFEAALDGDPFPMFGDGSQVRDFTFVDDVIAANVSAAIGDVAPGTVVNVCGGSSTTLLEVARFVGEIVGREVVLDRRPAEPGDVFRTGGSGARAEDLFGWRPVVDVAEGLRRQGEWHIRRRSADHPAAR